MINAKVHMFFGEGAGMLIEFSDPQGKYKDLPEMFVTVRDQTDLLQRLYFKNRMYICETICKWINQRMHAFPDEKNYRKLQELQNNIDHAKTYAYESLCALIVRKKDLIETYAPGEKSTCRKYYDHAIQPILTECINVATGKAKVHYC